MKKNSYSRAAHYMAKAADWKWNERIRIDVMRFIQRGIRFINGIMSMRMSSSSFQSAAIPK